MSESEELQTHVSAALYITSRDLDPAMIAERLGLKPTRIELKGSPAVDWGAIKELTPQLSAEIPETSLPFPSHYFIFEISHDVVKSRHDSSAQMLERAIDELLKKIEPIADRLGRLQGEASASLMCSYGSCHKPEWFILSDSLVMRIAALKLPVTVLLAPLQGDRRDGT